MSPTAKKIEYKLDKTDIIIIVAYIFLAFAVFKSMVLNPVSECRTLCNNSFAFNGTCACSNGGP